MWNPVGKLMQLQYTSECNRAGPESWLSITSYKANSSTISRWAVETLLEWKTLSSTSPLVSVTATLILMKQPLWWLLRTQLCCSKTAFWQPFHRSITIWEMILRKQSLIVWLRTRIWHQWSQSWIKLCKVSDLSASLSLKLTNQEISSLFCSSEDSLLRWNPWIPSRSSHIFKRAYSQLCKRGDRRISSVLTHR